MPLQLVLVLAFLFAIPSSEASFDSLRGGSLRVRSRNGWHSRKNEDGLQGEASEQKLDDTPRNSDQRVPASRPSRFAINNCRSTIKENAPMHTDVADLARDFHAAIRAINQDDQDIHVGHLLSACDRLQETMYKIGFSQGAKDIGGNIRKIRNIYNSASSSQRDSMPALLRYEMGTGVHARGIKDPSAAMGFIWLGRTLNYQYDMFRLMLDEHEEPYCAARRAYDQDLKPHQSWAVQKVCQAAMTTLKPMKRTSVLSRFGGFEEEAFGPLEHDATSNDIRELINSWQPLLARWKKVISDLDLGESI